MLRGGREVAYPSRAAVDAAKRDLAITCARTCATPRIACRYPRRQGELSAEERRALDAEMRGVTRSARRGAPSQG